MRERLRSILQRLFARGRGQTALSNEARARAALLLGAMLGPEADFREGQWEAIRLAVEKHARVLVVQRTGWGKSLVYFIAARMVKEAGGGPALLISPLLSLMRNQIEMAQRLGIRALTINSTNRDEWGSVLWALHEGRCDLLLISPERLANENFLNVTLPLLPRGIGLLVVDEAHCISDWGHDFRPDYRRIAGVVKRLPAGVPVLATTATANTRVAADIREQLGPRMKLQRGPLTRSSLVIQVIRLGDGTERLAWLAQHLPSLPGSGIIYCLTVNDCERVSRWLRSHGLAVAAYHARLSSEERVVLEQQLLDNEVKALVATVALGMGFDKPDLGFVVHYQRPGSVVAYYQQIGRAGRALETAYAILLSGREDDQIQEYFIKTAFPSVDQMRHVLDRVERSPGSSLGELLMQINLDSARVEHCLTLLEVEGALRRQGYRYWKTEKAWLPDEERPARVTQQRRQELQRMQTFVDWPNCLMEFVASDLDDDARRPCGRCAGCAGDVVDRSFDPQLAVQAAEFLKRNAQRIAPQQFWPVSSGLARHGPIPAWLQNAEGQALCVYGDAGWGHQVIDGKYGTGRFGDDLVDAAVELIRCRWRPRSEPGWVTAVPSLRHPALVPDLALRLAAGLGLPFRDTLVKVYETREQKLMYNAAQQVLNIAGAFRATVEPALPDPVLLVDDIVDSRWTFTLCGALRRQAGSGTVHPFALATAGGAVLP
ncbi:MAG: RecQ family ATP-dependent DNA helicase [Dehalococcoidia bacterium]